jgi:hypothetical protein
MVGPSRPMAYRSERLTDRDRDGQDDQHEQDQTRAPGGRGQAQGRRAKGCGATRSGRRGSRRFRKGCEWTGRPGGRRRRLAASGKMSWAERLTVPRVTQTMRHRRRAQSAPGKQRTLWRRLRPDETSTCTALGAPCYWDGAGAGTGGVAGGAGAGDGAGAGASGGGAVVGGRGARFIASSSSGVARRICSVIFAASSAVPSTRGVMRISSSRLSTAP